MSPSNCQDVKTMRLDKASDKVEKQNETEVAKNETNETEEGKGTVTKTKLRSVLEAASALTSLLDNEDDEEGSGESKKTTGKRYLPDHKKPDAALTFPEKLMNMMKFADDSAENKEEFCVAWLPDGMAFVIRDQDEFTRHILPKFFKATKFSSFTRKLYRWGFRQVNRGIGPDDPIIFGNENFQRDNAGFMVRMRSTTAAGIRKAHSMEAAAQARAELNQRKRPLESFPMFDVPHKRLMLELQQQQMIQNLAQAQAQPFNFSAPGAQSALMKSMAFRPNPMQFYMTSLCPASQPAQQNQQGHQASDLFPVQGGQYSNTSTVDIVNAAITALRRAP